MSINQAAIHYNLPYSSLYGRFKRCKYEGDFANIIDSNVQQNQHTESHLTHQVKPQENYLSLFFLSILFTISDVWTFDFITTHWKS